MMRFFKVSPLAWIYIPTFRLGLLCDNLRKQLGLSRRSTQAKRQKNMLNSYVTFDPFMPIDPIVQQSRRRPIVCTTVNFYHGNNIGRLPKSEFWMRSTAGHPRDIYQRATWRFCQYFGTRLVPGVQSKVDINTFNGPPEIWARGKSGTPQVLGAP